ncbi:MAG TPA: hypothetical protein VGM10_33210 [Actinocrinis sp.]|jgi:hypothetical protein
MTFVRIDRDLLAAARRQFGANGNREAVHRALKLACTGTPADRLAAWAWIRGHIDGPLSCTCVDMPPDPPDLVVSPCRSRDAHNERHERPE